MQYELRYQVIEPKRNTYQYLIDRYGDQPASRYLEASIDVEPRENFHYRPTWAPDRELYDARFSALRLTDPYTFTDPRQYYYSTYVSARASHHEEFANTLDYIQKRDLLAKMSAAWRTVVATAVVPLRHYESGAQLTTVAGARFANGTTIEQCCTFAAFDRIGNAQQLSRIGIALGAGTADILTAAKREWLEGAHLQPLRELLEHAMVADDWAEGVLAVDLVDSFIYPLVFAGLDEVALTGGGAAFSLLAQHFASWYADQRRWLDALQTVWATDPDHGEANRAELQRIQDTWLPQAQQAAMAVAKAIDVALPEAAALTTVGESGTTVTARWTTTLGADA